MSKCIVVTGGAGGIGSDICRGLGADGLKVVVADYAKDAAEKVPNQPLIRYHLGMAYYKNGNRDLAKKELNEALKIDPKFPGADEARAALNALK